MTLLADLRRLLRHIAISSLDSNNVQNLNLIPIVHLVIFKLHNLAKSLQNLVFFRAEFGEKKNVQNLYLCGVCVYVI